MNKILAKLIAILIVIFFCSCEKSGERTAPFETDTFIVSFQESSKVNSCTYYLKQGNGGFYITLPCNHKVGDSLFLRTINCK